MLVPRANTVRDLLRRQCSPTDLQLPHLEPLLRLPPTQSTNVNQSEKSESILIPRRGDTRHSRGQQNQPTRLQRLRSLSHAHLKFDMPTCQRDAATARALGGSGGAGEDPQLSSPSSSNSDLCSTTPSRFLDQRPRISVLEGQESHHSGLSRRAMTPGEHPLRHLVRSKSALDRSEIYGNNDVGDSGSSVEDLSVLQPGDVRARKPHGRRPLLRPRYRYVLFL